MAKSNLSELGLGLMSGTLSRHIVRTKDGIIIRCMVATVRNGKQRFYLREYRPRTTPISEKEKKQRTIFAEAAARWQGLSETERLAWHKEWKDAAYTWNGKKYGTLRGYCVARFMAELRAGVN